LAPDLDGEWRHIAGSRELPGYRSSLAWQFFGRDLKWKC
jgi:hypothetical protein